MSVRTIQDGPAYISQEDISGLVTLSFLKAWANNDSMKMGRLGFFILLYCLPLRHRGLRALRL